MFLDRLDAGVLLRALLGFAERYTVENRGRPDEAVSLRPCSPACSHFYDGAAPCDVSHLMDFCNWIASLAEGYVSFICSFNTSEAETARCALETYRLEIEPTEPPELPRLSAVAFRSLAKRLDREMQARVTEGRVKIPVGDRPLAPVLTFRPYKAAK